MTAAPERSELALTADAAVIAGAAPCSADLRGYAKGYAAGIKRVKALEAEISRLRELKTPLPPLPLPDSHDVTIEYLITTAEAMAGAANTLMAMRNPPNVPDQRPEAANT